MFNTLKRLPAVTASVFTLSTAAFAQLGAPERFSIHVPEEKLERVLDQMEAAQFPERVGAGDWSLGTSQDFMEKFRDYVVNDYDWRAAEAALNQYPQYKVDIDGFDIHYIHVRGEGDNPTPVIFTHGWPGSVFEFLHVIGPLTKPSEHGGKAEDAITVIVPSVPGYGWSELDENRVIGPKTTAQLWNKLATEVLGYERYGVQGGDIGSLVTSQIAAQFPDAVIGAHMNIVPWAWKPIETQTEEEKAWFAEGQQFLNTRMEYMMMQIQEPTTVAFALYDNPSAISAWILDKVYEWTDHRGDVTEAISMDDLATFVMIYALTDTIDSSVWWYNGIGVENGGVFHPTPGAKVDVPTAFALFPKDLKVATPPRSWVEDQYDIVQWTDMPSGGHFAAVEEPELFVEDVRIFFAGLKQ